jgi:hypothetical protein
MLASCSIAVFQLIVHSFTSCCCAPRQGANTALMVGLFCCLLQGHLQTPVCSQRPILSFCDNVR